MKKGVSPLIATVLLIGFIVALVAVVMLWGKGFVMERAQKEGSLAKKQLACTNVKIDVKQRGSDMFLINKGIEPIDGLIIRRGNNIVQCKPGSKKCDFDKLKQLEEFEIQNIVGNGDIDIIPALIPEGGVGAPLVPCSEKMKTILK